MKKVSFFILCSVILFSCGPAADKLPSAPADVASVATLVKGKKFSVKKVGLTSAIPSPGSNTSIQWIDPAAAQGFEKDAVEALTKFTVEFLNDTSAVIVSGEKRFEGTYAVDDTMDEYDKEEGIKIRLTYVDPDMSFGSEPMEITYTYPVKGAADNKLLLQFPRSINRQPVVGLLSE
ncbi:MAG: hypothetical protein KIT62_00200 [Cyclobacteriaceae bacterium]|nr:hypothetical protein [Cyclobacteriaceae bacterium]